MQKNRVPMERRNEEIKKKGKKRWKKVKRNESSKKKTAGKEQKWKEK